MSSGKGKGVGPPKVSRDELYSNSHCFNSSPLGVCLFLWLERKGMGGALLYSTRNHKPAPGVRVQNVPRLQTTPLWLREAPEVGWGTVTLHCLRALCLATSLGFHCPQTMRCPKGPGLSYEISCQRITQHQGSL